MERTTIKGTEARLAGESVEKLRELIPVGAEVHSIIRSVSASGMSRNISFFVVDPKDNRITNVTWHMARALRTKPREWHGHWVIYKHGVGMDMAFATVYDLGIVLYGDGYALKSCIM